mmetsp:Transcript_28729/g.21412  ORF Transcript_28729/g.21412 Transcript_28729/m.21412 type:complete len:113 (+) Transcript_28729:168-506(+)|eukprot:CAMPEP_0202964376 /NCGR_PEP_ID=MMETSP1396-20130829/8457_1 /ASSEMBLY_ACC=CAM_ASM_000872 /TAXON_ID= /ORGANISM="Pseudokeronopsis sp., Strain Brazil" /LENGTH=112 /DNA_ID=CAMNT_0049686433 /DNA_START=151 /DNA_END=489 /DNA_ORIENTATION=-
MQIKIISIRFEAQSMNEILEEMRKDLVNDMQSGETYVLFLDKLAPNFKEEFTHPTVFPADKIFNFNLWRKEYRIILKKEEDKDLSGNAGFFRMDDDFNIVILSHATDPEEQK